MSLSRDFAAFVAGLSYEDLPPAVVDRAKGVTLQALTSALVAHDMPASRQALALMQEEEAGGGGVATVLCNGAKLTKAGAAFVNAEMIFAGGKWDTFRMLTHPGTAILPAALVAAEIDRRLGQRVPHRGRRRLRGHGAHGRRVHPDGDVARLPRRAGVRHLRRGGRGGEDRAGSTPTRSTAPSPNASTSPSGNLEGARSGGRSLREGGAVRNALLAVAMAQAWHARRRDHAGRRGRLLPCLCRQQPRRVALQLHRRQPHRPRARSPQGLGRDWIFLETLYRIYSTAGYNIAHVDVTAALCEEHDITYADIDRIEAVVNWFETEYPSPPSRLRGIDGKPRVGSTQYFTAYGAVDARLSAAARRPARPGRERPAGSARPDAPRHADPDGAPHAVRPAHHGLHQGRPQLHPRRHRPRVHLGFRGAGAAHPPGRAGPGDRRGAIRPS